MQNFVPRAWAVQPTCVCSPVYTRVPDGPHTGDEVLHKAFRHLVRSFPVLCIGIVEKKYVCRRASIYIFHFKNKKHYGSTV